MDENISVGRYTWARITFCRVVLGVTGECGGEVQSGIWLLELAICHCQLIFVRGCANINNSGLRQLWGGGTHEWVHVCVNASSLVGAWGTTSMQTRGGGAGESGNLAIW